MSPVTGTPIAKAADNEMSSPPSRQSLPTIPLPVAPPIGGIVGVANESVERVCSQHTSRSVIT